jgi:hypothetical protein
MPCKPNIHPANSIRHAYSWYDYVCANVLALTCYFRQSIGAVNVHIVALPIRRDNAYL